MAEGEANGARAPLAGRRVLVVEDEFLIALDIEAALQALGCTVIGPAPTIERALALLAESDMGLAASGTSEGAGTPEAALLDVNLRGELVTPFARQLAERGLPFLLVTGYGAAELPEPLQRSPRLQKPFTVADLLRALLAMLPAREA